MKKIDATGQAAVTLLKCDNASLLCTCVPQYILATMFLLFCVPQKYLEVLLLNNIFEVELLILQCCDPIVVLAQHALHGLCVNEGEKKIGQNLSSELNEKKNKIEEEFAQYSHTPCLNIFFLCVIMLLFKNVYR